jgi:hypothetical protein
MGGLEHSGKPSPKLNSISLPLAVHARGTPNPARATSPERTAADASLESYRKMPKRGQ